MPQVQVVGEISGAVFRVSSALCLRQQPAIRQGGAADVDLSRADAKDDAVGFYWMLAKETAWF